MAQGETAGKESTLLSQSELLLKMANELEAVLSNRFRRNPTPEETNVEGRPQQDNVLDEIADNLETLTSKIQESITFLTSFVLPKLN